MSYPTALTNPSQANWPVVVNENAAVTAAVAMYGRNYATSSGLTLGYFGGHIASTAIADGTIALDASQAAVYVVAHRTTGAVSKATTTTNWNDTATYGRMFKAATSGSAITAIEDWREQVGGWFDRSGAIGGALLAANNLSDVASAASAAANLQGTGASSSAAGFRGLPVNSQSVNYTTVLSDVGKSVRHPSGSGAGDTFTIDSQANVAWPDGAAITFENRDSNALSIAITTDTLRWAATGGAGTRTLAQYGIATAVFDDAINEWLISGTGLS